jgi:guanylate kinase
MRENRSERSEGHKAKRSEDGNDYSLRVPKGREDLSISEVFPSGKQLSDFTKKANIVKPKAFLRHDRHLAKLKPTQFWTLSSVSAIGGSASGGGRAFVCQPFGRLAQLVEHLLYTQRVEGSSPPASTIHFRLSSVDRISAMDKAELEQQQKYYLQQILLTVCGGKIDPETYKFNHVFLVFGWTGSGKDALMDRFLKTTSLPFSKFIRTLTRPGRPGEAPVSDAFFVKPDFFDYLKQNKKFFFFYEKYDGDQFGFNIMHFIFLISRGHVLMTGGGEKNLPGLIEGIHQIFPEVPITSIFVNRPKDQIIQGIRKRGGAPKEVEKRVAHIQSDWTEKPKRPFDHLVWNDRLDEAEKEFARIIESTIATPPKG